MIYMAHIIFLSVRTNLGHHNFVQCALNAFLLNGGLFASTFPLKFTGGEKWFYSCQLLFISLFKLGDKSTEVPWAIQFVVGSQGWEAGIREGVVMEDGVSFSSQRLCLGPRRWPQFSRNQLDTSSKSVNKAEVCWSLVSVSRSCDYVIWAKELAGKSSFTSPPENHTFLLVWWEEMENSEGQSGVEQGNNCGDWERPNGWLVVFLSFSFLFPPGGWRGLKL